ncbi:MAG: acyltransferase [Minicystis sp.]
MGEREPARRLPSLDGLRGVLVIVMLNTHLLGTRGYAGVRLGETFGDFGYLAVIAFFVISGFLITTLLLAEIERTGRVDLVAFYRRRLFRIFPAFYAHVALVSVAAAIGIIAVPPRDLAAAAAYVVNYVHDRSWYVGHLWSLSVEEHFYLLWPATLLILPGATMAAKRRNAALTALAVIVASPLLRLATLRFFPGETRLVGQTTHTVADAIAFGCLLACARDRLWEDPRYRAFLGSRAFWIVPLVALASNWTYPHIRIFSAVGATISDLCVMLVVDRVMRFPYRLSGRILDARPLVFLGVRGYSIYLWQQPFLHREGTSILQAFPCNLVLALACGLLSYQLVEGPMMRIRERRASPRIAGA